MADETKTVTVQAVQWHTYEGKEYQPGETYEIDAQYADSVQAQGKAFRVGQVPAQTAPKAAGPAKPAAQAPATTEAPKAGHPVGPMTTDDLPEATTRQLPDTEPKK